MSIRPPQVGAGTREPGQRATGITLRRPHAARRNLLETGRHIDSGTHRREPRWVRGQTRRPGAEHAVNKALHRLTTWLVCAAASVAIVTPSLTASASADDTDDDFLAALQQHGIVFDDRDATITAGRGVCTGLDQGLSPTALILIVRKNSNLSAHTAAYFFGAAVRSYCPDSPHFRPGTRAPQDEYRPVDDVLPVRGSDGDCASANLIASQNTNPTGGAYERRSPLGHVYGSLRGASPSSIRSGPAHPARFLPLRWLPRSHRCGRLRRNSRPYRYVRRHRSLRSFLGQCPVGKLP
ncbi:DUF732 domain-containing protein [Mycobacterium sp.]|uniref:DUF732 domain-containing protein n=1 Tax=Mycobacterium sp. TaxID=1785 RepID=UPI003427BA4A